jgi:hypothetical protein
LGRVLAGSQEQRREEESDGPEHEFVGIHGGIVSRREQVPVFDI